MSSKGPYLDQADTEEKVGTLQSSTEQIQAAFEKTTPVRCPSATKLLIYGTRGGRTFRPGCKRWSCPACGRHNVRLCAWLIEAGLLEALDDDLLARYFVVTSLPERLSPSDLQIRWNRFRTSFIRKGKFQSYAATIEVVNERPHLNVVTVGGQFIHTSWLNRISSNAGLGGVWAGAVGKTEEDAYRLSMYVTKGARTAAAWTADGGSKRVCPANPPIENMETLRNHRRWTPLLCGAWIRPPQGAAIPSTQSRQRNPGGRQPSSEQEEADQKEGVVSIKAGLSFPAETGLSVQLGHKALERIIDAVAEQIKCETPNDDSPWMTTKETAEYLRCGEGRVRKLSMTGCLPREKDGSRNLYHRKDLDEFIRRGGGISP